MNNTPLVSLRHVGVSYDGKPALIDIDLEIRANDFIGIVGPNGGGKTTLVKTILGLVPHTGEIRLDDSLRTAAGRIGYLPQQNNIDPAFPILTEEVIASGLQSGRRLMGRIRPEERRRIAELMETAGITRLRGQAVGTLSGGEMQRVLLCRALISDPALLILDEPSNFVDPRFEHEPPHGHRDGLPQPQHHGRLCRPALLRGPHDQSLSPHAPALTYKRAALGTKSRPLFWSCRNGHASTYPASVLRSTPWRTSCETVRESDGRVTPRIKAVSCRLARMRLLRR